MSTGSLKGEAGGFSSTAYSDLAFSWTTDELKVDDITGVPEGFFSPLWLWLQSFSFGLLSLAFPTLSALCNVSHKESDVPCWCTSSCTSTDGISAALERVLNDSNALEVWDAISEHTGCDNSDDDEEVDDSDNEAKGWPNEKFSDDDDDNIDEADGWPNENVLEHDKLLSEVDNKGSAFCTPYSDVGVLDNVLREMDKRGVGCDNDNDSCLHGQTGGFCGEVFKGSDIDCDPTWPERLLRGTESTECWDDVWKRLSGVEPDNIFPDCDKLPRGADNKDLFANDIAGSVDGWLKLLV